MKKLGLRIAFLVLGSVMAVDRVGYAQPLPPSISKNFAPSQIALNATSSLGFMITNPNGGVSLTGVAFSDTLPAGLTVANSTTTFCGGTITTTAPTRIALTGASIAAASQCVFSVIVTGAASGNYTNTTGNVTSTNGGTGNTASANLTVSAPPTISKAFGLATIPLNGTTSLTFTITNPNTSGNLTGIAFTDNLPAGLVVATPNGLSNNCGGCWLRFREPDERDSGAQRQLHGLAQRHRHDLRCQEQQRASHVH